MKFMYQRKYGIYSFDWREMFIHNPYWSECGRFEVPPTEYGFTEWNSGGNIMVLRKEGLLEDGTPATMLVSTEYEKDKRVIIITLECELDHDDSYYSYTIPYEFELLEDTKVTWVDKYNWSES